MSVQSDMAREAILQKQKLTLDAYLSAVESNYPGLASAQSQRQVATAVRIEKRGAFDPLLSTEDGYTKIQNTSKIGDVRGITFNYPKLEIPFQSGIRTFVQYRLNPNSAQTPYVETGEGGEYGYGVLVPLLRGLFVNEQSIAFRQAKLGEGLATQTFFLQRFDILLRAGTTYSNWVGGNTRINVAKEIFHLSKMMADIAQQQEQAGDLAKIYVAEAQEDVQRREADLFQTQRDFQKNSFQLSTFLFDVGGIPLPLPEEINSPDQLSRPIEFDERQKAECIAIAILQRPELQAIDIQRKITEADLQLAKNQMLPVANAVFTNGYDTGYHGVGTVYRAQMTFSEPLFLHVAKGKMMNAKMRLDKLNRDRQAEEQRIRNQVLDAISAINLAYKRYGAVEQQVQRAQQVYEGERERFKVGDSTVFLVVQREQQLNEARLRLIDAQVEYHIGLLALRAITCQL
jgi:outer membrane protein TolC